MPNSITICCFLLFLLSCNSRAIFPRTIAHGKPPTCPQVPTRPLLEGGSSPDQIRCTYADSLGGMVTRMTGKVLAEAQPGFPGIPMAEIYIRVHAVDGPLRLGDPGPELGHATSNQQGSFSISRGFQPGEYVLLAYDQSRELLLAYHLITVDQHMAGPLKDIVIWIPVDKRLQEESKE